MSLTRAGDRHDGRHGAPGAAPRDSALPASPTGAAAAMALGPSDPVWSVSEYVRDPVRASGLGLAIRADEREKVLTRISHHPISGPFRRVIRPLRHPDDRPARL